MATPMILPGSCCLCWEGHGGGTFDVTAQGLALVDICAPCRIAETALMIRFRAGEEGD